MKYRLLLPIITLAVLVGATVGYNSWLLQRLTAQAELQTQNIAQGYDDIVREYIVPLIEADTLTAAQQQHAERIQTILAELALTNDIYLKVNGISNVQKEIIGFVLAASPEASSDANITALMREMGERGSIRTLLKDYNTTALRMNSLVQGSIGSVAAVAGDVSQNPLPFLKFDGEQEFVTEVSL